MRKKSISRETYDFLKDHIAQIEKERDSLIREHYPENTDESMDIKELFRSYIGTVSDYLASASVGVGNGESCPFVIINSVVEVQDTEDMDVYQYRVVLPYSRNTDFGIDCATCLSPLGRELLLKGVNQKANIQIPTGTLHYVIKKITLPEQPNLKPQTGTTVEKAANPGNIGLPL